MILSPRLFRSLVFDEEDLIESAIERASLDVIGAKATAELKLYSM
jgi:hypothetical protein